MPLELLLNSSASQDDINAVISEQMANLTIESFQKFINSIKGSEIGYNILASLLLSLAQALSQISDISLQARCLDILVKYLEESQIEDKKFDIYQIYAKSLKDNEQYTKAAEVLQMFPLPSLDHEILQYYLDLAELYFKDERLDKVSDLLIKMSQHFFKLTTPLPLANRYYLLKGAFHIKKKSFLEAARCFIEVWTRGKTPEQCQQGLRNAVICTILAPTSNNNVRSLFLHRFYANENIKSVDVFPILDLIVKGKFIDKAVRDDFREKIQDVVDINETKTLESFSLEHNISIAKKMFVSVKIDRLAQIVGDTPDNVYNTLQEMIHSKSIEALIDQPLYSVEFIFENKRATKDKSIQQFCLSVAETSKKIKDINK